MHHGSDLDLLLFLVRLSQANVAQILECLCRAIARFLWRPLGLVQGEDKASRQEFASFFFAFEFILA